MQTNHAKGRAKGSTDKADHWIASGPIQLHAVSYGQQDRTPLVLVHGYPDNHQVWQPVAERLAREFYVIAYDVRGAGQSDVPQAEADYRLELLVADLQAVVDGLIPGRRFHLAGHDWGSVQSWEAVTTDRLQGRIASFTSISGPSLDHIGFLLRRKAADRSWSTRFKMLRQAMRSWYVGFFHLPYLAPASWKSGLAKLWPKYLKYREGVTEAQPSPTLSKDGENGIQLYRANFRERFMRPRERHAHCPVQLIVPLRDHYVGPDSFDDLHLWVRDLYRREVDACHWVLLSDPDIIAGWIREFVGSIETGKLAEPLRVARVQPERSERTGSREAASFTLH